MSKYDLQPDLSAGHCVTGTELTPDAWISDDPGLRAKAVEVCGRCPVLEPCRDWARSMASSWRGDVVLGGVAYTHRKRAGNG